MRYLFNSYSKQIDTLNTLNLKSKKINSEWGNILKSNFDKTTTKRVEPLLKTNWDQGWPYNSMCPENPLGPGGHANAGCVAIALAQIMKYHEWPEKGAGKLTYLNNLTDTLSVNFSEQEFQWDNIPDDIVDNYDEAAKLIFSVGASVGSQYGSSSTSVSLWSTSDSDGSINTKLPMDGALSYFFRYNYDSLKARIHTDYLFYEKDWIKLLKDEIDNSRPLYLQGGEFVGSRHAWVCDGYDENDFFHFNFGWSGQFNGYFSLSDITGFGFNFTKDLLAVTGIIPDTVSLVIDKDTSLSDIHYPKGNVIIPRGITLTLNPSCQLRMGNNKSIISMGTLKSLGTADNKVLITAADTNSGWKGIYHDDAYLTFYNNIDVQDTNLFYHTEFSFSSGDCLSLSRIRNQYTKIDNCQFLKHSGNGFLAQDVSFSLTNSFFQNIGHPGIREGILIGNINSIVENNIFKGTYIVISKGGKLEFNNNYIIENSQLRLGGSDCIFDFSNFRSNIFYGNDCAVTCSFASGNFTNNLFANNNMAFVSIDSRNRLYNNTFANNNLAIELKKGPNAHLVELSKGLATDTLRYNIIFNNKTNLIINGSSLPNIYKCIIQNGIDGIDNQSSMSISSLDFNDIIDGNPRFKNPNTNVGIDTTSSFNYSWNLDSNSAAIDIAGIDTSGLLLPITDLDNNPRINRSLDLGAYESIETPVQCPVVLKSPLSSKVCEGNPLMLSALFKGDSLTYKWFFNSVIIENQTRDSLIIDYTTTDNTGDYLCVAQNSYGIDTTSAAHVFIDKVPEFGIDNIQGPDTITWWQKSINYCVSDYPNALYTWNILGNISSDKYNCKEYMASEFDSSGIIKVNVTDICGRKDSLYKNIIIEPFKPDEPFGIIIGPSVVYKGEYVFYKIDHGDYDLSATRFVPYGFKDFNNLNLPYLVTDDALPHSVFETYWYRYSDNWVLYSGEKISLDITVVDSASQLPFIQGPEKFSYSQDTVTYSIDSLTSASEYEWIYPEGLIPISNTSERIIRFNVDSVFTEGKIQVRGINRNWRGTYFEKIISRTLYPSSAGNISGITTVCQGQDSVTYTVSEVPGATSYVWTLPGGVTGKSTTNSITVNFGPSAVSGNITVKGANSYGKGKYSSLPVTVKTKPADPIISIDGSVLESTVKDGNQWYNERGLINGGNSQTFSALNNGNYFVIVTLDGCSSYPSNIINYISTGMNYNEGNSGISLFPNPVSNELCIEISGNDKRLNFEIINNKGQVFFKDNIFERAAVNTSILTPGAYILKFENGKTFDFIKKITH